VHFYRSAAFSLNLPQSAEGHLTGAASSAPIAFVLADAWLKPRISPRIAVPQNEMALWFMACRERIILLRVNMAGVIDQIKAWATGLAYWERLALDKIAGGPALTSEDYQELLARFMEDIGLSPMPTSRPLTSCPIAIDAAGAGGAAFRPIYLTCFSICI
jgi:hypothetical protein